MVAFFIYNGRLYTQTGQYADDSLKGHYICTVTGNIDEWSGADEYVEGASSIAGDVFYVKHYDTNFRLCMDGPDGQIEFYDCLSGMTLCSGADLFGTCLHIENYVGAYYILDADWEEEADNRHELDPESLEAFVALLMASPCRIGAREVKTATSLTAGTPRHTSVLSWRTVRPCRCACLKTAASCTAAAPCASAHICPAPYSTPYLRSVPEHCRPGVTAGAAFDFFP